MQKKTKTKMAVWETLQIAVKRREVKNKGEKERCKHLNAEFQRIARTSKQKINKETQTLNEILEH